MPSTPFRAMYTARQLSQYAASAELTAISSSPFALCNLADTAVGRVREPELTKIAELAADIEPKSTGKGQELLKALKRAFVELKKGCNPQGRYLHRITCYTWLSVRL